MPTELEELVGFIAHPNPQIRKLATENLVPYSTEQPAIFKTEELRPVKHLKFLIRDHPLTLDVDPLQDPAEANANLLAMLLANMAKWDGLKSVATRKQDSPEALKSNELVLNQLLDLFVKGADGTYNKDADFDYLAYVFADLSKHPEIRQFFITKQDYDDVVPINKIKVFTEHKSDIRRKGVASTIKNVAFDVPAHPAFLDEDQINILPYLLLPITGNEEYDDEETMGMLPDLQLLPPDKQRDADPNIVQTHVETLTLLTTTRKGRELMRNINVYPIIRETHLHVNDDGVREACERLVQVLMRDEAEPGVEEVTEEDEDDRIVEV
ncbi:hypothetical protein NEMBOFW57_007401 [Staphylotrichum longicolle]|uniref:Protein HGH1 homolog n=1 Tax=Staphylotrichum longicolle TaxID=669026 RepID=A0AAD4HV55_9PEZI|nr:hypothetical protein NEMBOFW57_007401 [Staphylotrichum longicolle]